MVNADWRLIAGLGPSQFSTPHVDGLPEDIQESLDLLVSTWKARYPSNITRQMYLDAKATVANLGLALPDEIFRDLQLVSSWPETAVFSLANRCRWDGVVAPDGEDRDPWGLATLLQQNRFSTEVDQAIASALTHGVAFMVTLPGSGDGPDALVMPYSALSASALWDRRRRCVKAGMVINDVDYLGAPTEIIFMDDRLYVVLNLVEGSGWVVSDWVAHPLGRTPMEPLVYKPALDRPLGRSRLSRGVLSIVDRALRVSTRLEVSSELFTAPGLLLRGVDEGVFAQLKESWSWRLGSVKGVSRDEEGEIPEVTTIPQQSMQPFLLQLNQLAQELASALRIPVSSLGIVQDNPSSADAIYAAKEELVIEASSMNALSSYALSRTYQNLLMLRDNTDVPPAEFISTHWVNPALPSTVSQSDAIIKQVSAIPELAYTDVVLEELGYDNEQIQRIQTQIKRRQAQDALTGILSGSTQPAAQQQAGTSAVAQEQVVQPSQLTGVPGRPGGDASDDA